MTTVSDLIDYLGQFKGGMPVVLKAEDIPSDSSDGFVVLEWVMGEMNEGKGKDNG